ncbi:uncharacterized protein LOC122666894 [Telopea speciosissima]|uniref:uncharacterized protein LOC122666894 n=1 Tax=Telopea speciosissima TaxID=54955 RepID=UPI001CC4448C|nr:uncharacterized protein LOC122666894 [Telopea speciosissima]XP_043718940.1 uncharacterized protein LOC122666894 [Telopea speciosissima]
MAPSPCMDSNQLIDSLTSHIALYHSSTPSTSASPSVNYPRNSVLRWFSSLTVQHRQSSLTIVDAKFAEIILQMQKKIRRHGHGCFIILSDLPSSDCPDLPSLCFRRSTGLLARTNVSNDLEQSISRAVRMFGSQEGERIEECSAIDSITFSEDFVSNVDRFVCVMDNISNGQFLRSEENALGVAWEELPWLKAKGYYSIEAFLANKLEVALRLSWLNSNGGKKRGMRAKEKEKTTVAGVAANVYFRKMGCLDWWAGVDTGVRKKILQVVLGKAAKYLTKGILKGAKNTLEDDIWLFGERAEKTVRYNDSASSQRTILPNFGMDAEFCLAVLPAPISGKCTPFTNFFNGLLVLREMSAMVLACKHNEFEKDKLFFSTLGSVHSVSDCILRKVRDLLMVISGDCIKLELLGEESMKFQMNKSEEKFRVGNRRGKGRGRNQKRQNLGGKSSRASFAIEKSTEVHGHELAHREQAKSDGMTGRLQAKDLHKETSFSRVEMERAKEIVDGKVQTAGKKKKKESSRSKNSTLEEPETRDSEVRIEQVTSQHAAVQTEAAESQRLADASTIQTLPNNIPVSADSLAPNPSFCSSTNKNDMYNGDEVAHGTQECSVIGSAEDGSHIGLECFPPSYGAVGAPITSGGETSSSKFNSDIAPHALPGLELDNVLKSEEVKHQTSRQLSDTVISEALTEAIISKEETSHLHRQDGGNYCSHGSTSSSGCTSFEWPSVTPVNFPSLNSQHLPAATDRLHLDVDHNWRNNFHQSYVSTRHQARNPLIDGGCSRIMSRTSAMSLDWPPVVRSASRLTPSMNSNYDTGFIPRMHSPYQQSFPAHGLQLNGARTEDERKYSGDVIDSCAPELVDDSDSHWISEEEFEVHAISGRDYNQYFGGGVMYWNTSDHAGTSFSRPPSLSSDDSSWAWHEADMNRTIDDMIGFSSSYSTNGLTSPPASPFRSPFDPLGPGHQALGYVIPGNDVSGKVLHSSTVTDGVPEENTSGSLNNSSGGVVEGQKGDSLPYPILRPIIIPNMSRKGSRSEFKLSHDLKSPCVPRNRQEQPRVKRPPSPVVLCVPRAPRPPPPSPVGESRKQRGFPTVRSGSSSPRHWGMRSWYHDGTNCEEPRICLDGAEVIWPSWRNKSLSATSMSQPLPGALLQDRLIAISQLALDQEHPDVAFPLQPPELLNCPTRKASLSLMHNLLHDEIDSFCKQVAAQNLTRKPYINWAVKRVARSLQVLWPRSRTNIFGSYTTGLSLPTSDVDLVVCLPPVRNLEPIKEAGILEGRNGIKETCLQHAARYLANQEWVKNDSLKTVENTAIPIIMLVAEVPHDLVASTASTSKVQAPKVESTQLPTEQGGIIDPDMVGLDKSSWPKCLHMKNDDVADVKSVRLDISFKSPSHTGLQTTELVRELTEQFPAATPLALVLKQFLADRSLDHSYSGGLSSYCLVLLIIRFLQHEHHLGRPINQNLGSLLMDFLYFFGNLFDPRQMRISIQGNGIYVNRERGHSIDPIHIDDPLFPTNNVGRNCFRIHQCIKAFADAYSSLENELTSLPSNGDPSARPSYRLLPKIVPSIHHV